MCKVKNCVNKLVLFSFFLLMNSLQFISAKIVISIKLNTNKSDIVVKYSGNDIKVITDTEINIFNLTNEKLNRGMRIELGKAPDDFYLKDPTYYGDLYKKFKWSPVKRSLEVNNAKIIDVYNEEIRLTSSENINNSSLSVIFQRKLHENIINTAQSTWNVYGLPNDEFFYDLDLNFGYGSFKYENKWRSNILHSKNMSIGVVEQGLINNEPYETVVTELYATQTIVLIELEYKAKLTGSIVANYAKTYGKYHFWAPSIENIMKAAEMNNKIITKELIEIKCFLYPRLHVFNKLTRDVIEPPRKKRLLMKILRGKNTSRVLYFKKKKPQEEEKKESEIIID